MNRLIKIAVVLMLLVFPSTAFASVTLQVKPGLNGLYKQNSPVELNISIVNSGEALENAVLEVKTADPERHSSSEGIYQRVVDVPANKRINTSMLIPGDMAAGQPLVQLTTDGKAIAATKVQGLAVRDMVVVSVGERPLSGGMPAWLELNRSYANVKYMSPEGMSTNSLALAMVADIIVVEKQNALKLTPEQVKAIRQWVALGGKLLISGGAGAGESQPFADITPVQVSGETTISSNWNDLKEEVEPMKVAVGKLVRGETVIEESGVPLVARYGIGRGNVIYSAASLANINSQDNKIWELFFNKFNGEQIINDLNRHYYGGNKFPQLEMPSIKSMSLIWAVYLLMVSPVIYLVLKRYNKRDWAWLCIPAAAFITAVVIYYNAPFHQLKGPLGNNNVTVEILDKDVAEIKANGSYVSPRGGEFQLRDTGVGLITPRNAYRGNGSWEEPPIVRYTDEGKMVQFNNVEFWSMREANVYKVVENFGQLDGELKIKGERIIGTLTNNTPVDLKECVAVVGDKGIKIGKLLSGESTNVDLKLSEANNFSWQYEMEEWFSETRQIEVQEKYMVETKSVSPTRDDKENNIIELIGYTDHVPGLMRITGEDAQNYYSSLVTQEMSFALQEQGEFKLPGGYILPSVIDGGGINRTPEGTVVNGNRVTLEYDLNLPVQGAEAQINTVQFSNMLKINSYEVKIYNWQQKKWEGLKPLNQQLVGNKLDEYLSADKLLRIRIKRSLDKHDSMPLPELAVEGVVK
ncbi:MAG: hypothetical protein FH758_00195 [Firmicutes bacterium]|nr:hypothetical protein [Bacillota bacterium]